VAWTLVQAARPMSALQGLCLAGPTAAGKTAVALAWPNVGPRWPVEIISVDSALVYRGMDIGTAKPSAAERAAVPHHLIDIVEPTDAYSAAQFVADALRLAAEIRARGRLPLLVGGTMLYFKALREGIDAMPPADAGVRRAGRTRRARRLAGAARRAGAGGPGHRGAAAAGRRAAHPARAGGLAVSGRPLSDWQQGPPREADSAAWPLLALEPASRAGCTSASPNASTPCWAGLVDEVRALRARGDLHAGLPSMRCVGYRQAWEALDQRRPARPGRTRHRRHAAAGQAPADLAARHAAPGGGLRRGRCAAAGPGRAAGAGRKAAA
jgi:tRNA dimethylallyltransferase